MSGRRALIVANDAYEQDGLRDLVAPGADAEALGRVLGDPQIGGFAVSVIRNEAAHVIQAQVEEFFADNDLDDVLLLHFSCHGLKSQSGELYLAAANTRPERLGSTAVPASFVNGCMQASRARSVVLLLDCCYGGAFARGLRARDGAKVSLLDSFPQEPSADGGRAVITASGATEFAFEGDELAENHGRPSVFTAAVVEGLATGDADRDEDGWVGLGELYDYVYAQVRQRSPHQRPGRIMELSGELYLARSRRRRIRPEAVHPDLQAALTSDNMYARLGAVDELRTRLGSADLPAAAGAHAALAEVARNDIQYVAGRAAAALGDAAIRPDPAALDFGEVPHGGPVPHQPVRLGGPPLARAITVRPSADWISVSQDEDVLDVSVGTGRAGTLHGSVTLSGTAGAVVVPVTASIIAPTVASPAPEPPSTALPEPGSAAGSASETAREAEPEPNLAAEARPEPTAEAEPEPAAEAQPEPEPAAEAQPEAEAEAEPEPKPTGSRKTGGSASSAGGVMSPPAPAGSRPQNGGVMSASASTRQQRREKAADAAAQRSSSGPRDGPAGMGPWVAGSALVILMAIAGIVYTYTGYQDGPKGTPDYLQVLAQARFVLPLLVAVAAVLPRGRRWTAIGILQGMAWPLAATVPDYIVLVMANGYFRQTGTSLAVALLSIGTAVLSLAAALVLLTGWRTAAVRRQPRRPEARALPVAILVTLALAVVAATGLFLLGPHGGAADALVVTEAATGLSVGWYALSLRSRSLGSALLLGWTLQVALIVLPNVLGLGPGIPANFAAGTAAIALLTLLAIHALAYRRHPPNPPAADPDSPAAPAATARGA